jgi:hypothetical protein
MPALFQIRELASGGPDGGPDIGSGPVRPGFPPILRAGPTRTGPDGVRRSGYSLSVNRCESSLAGLVNHTSPSRVAICFLDRSCA